jgi:hypothetical protein
MPLVAKVLANDMKAFITQVNAMPVQDAATAIDKYCQKLEEVVYNAIKSLEITIPSGGIVVVGSQTTQTNPQPIILTGNVT